MNFRSPQPAIEEPIVELGAMVWADEDGNDVGEIVNLTETFAMIKFSDRVARYSLSSISCQLVPPYLVLIVSTKNEELIHRYK